ncbi:MAG: hypothetical protein IJW29_06395 [Clostridia bacterium]|nr:hypothetical protein [Clostridia bacterium]
MPTNDERCEVAAKLRHVAERGAPEWATSACCIAECLGEDDYPLWGGSEKLFALLADLIEPDPERACHVVDVVEWHDGHDAHFDYELSCGHEHTTTGMPPKFCAECGARVIA